jgi:hypothetical protein
MADVPQFITLKKITVGQALQKKGNSTTSELVKLTGKDIKLVHSALKTLYTSNKIHIGGYSVSKRGKLSKVWAWGDGDDALEPNNVRHREEFIPRPDVAAAWLRNPI